MCVCVCVYMYLSVYVCVSIFPYIKVCLPVSLSIIYCKLLDNDLIKSLPTKINHTILVSDLFYVSIIK